MMDLGDRVLAAPHRAEAVRHRLESRLEDRLQDQHQGSLHQPVHRGGYPQPPELPRLPGLGNKALPYRQRAENPRLQLVAGIAQEGHDVGVLGNEPGNHPVYPRCARSLVAPHPFPRDCQEVRVVDEVVRSDRSAVPEFPLARFCGPPPEPDVPVGQASGSPQARRVPRR
jgi:hypothetical protein